MNFAICAPTIAFSAMLAYEKKQLKDELRETKKELGDLQIRKSWEDYPEMMGR